MKIKITILDDQISDRQLLRNHITKWAQENNCVIEIEEFETGEDYLNIGICNLSKTHLVFLDVQMKDVSGLEVAKIIREQKYQGEIIFLSAFREYVFNGYEVHALNYLLKPIDPASLCLCLDEISNNIAAVNYIHQNGKEINNIPCSEIICFSSRLHSVEILTTSSLFVQNSSLNESINFLPREFIRVHRSFIVNLAHIRNISRNIITLTNHKTIPIGRTYLKTVFDQFISYSCRFKNK
ncbi:MAG TPA: LytTR family DNA-binding domain-containing protein [Lachnospiraceae bacterium]|nr:LytTR family DNA-binding domain-containing protein [Lachnospiraceae bacterium]